jgi:hypothetical protein
LKLFLKYFSYCFGIVLTLWSFSSCDPDENKPKSIGLEYFPLQKGFYQVYDVGMTQYSQGSSPVTENFEMKLEVVDSFASTSSEITYVIHRSVRTPPATNWSVLDTWSARKNDRELVVSEGNISYLKLLFPIREGSKWDGNTYNTQGTDEFELTDVDTPYQLEGGTTFDNTVTVVQENNEDFILFLDQRKEVYAKDAGLIYKEIIRVHYCEEDNCRGQQIVEDGIEYRQSLKESGTK